MANKINRLKKLTCSSLENLQEFIVKVIMYRAFYDEGAKKTGVWKCCGMIQDNKY